MTHRSDVAVGRDIVARWCNLAEQRLEYLTELFETGRWRRYHTELAFLENIQEAKTAVETWRSLSMREASPDNSAVDMSWLGHTQSALPRAERLREQSDLLPALPVEIIAELPPEDVSIAAEPELVASDEAPSAPALDTPILEDEEDGRVLTLDAIAQRYPLLRNAL
ncbi:MAG: TIGR03809 family protein [Pseudomonadota bacterium]